MALALEKQRKMKNWNNKLKFHRIIKISINNFATLEALIKDHYKDRQQMHKIMLKKDAVGTLLRKQSQKQIN